MESEIAVITLANCKSESLWLVDMYADVCTPKGQSGLSHRGKERDLHVNVLHTVSSFVANRSKLTSILCSILSTVLFTSSIFSCMSRNSAC